MIKELNRKNINCKSNYSISKKEEDFTVCYGC